MKKALWTAVLSLAACLSLGCGLGACAKTKDPAEHTHTYDAWDYDETQHWKYCDDHGADKSNIDQATRAPHDFSSGDCVCGAKKPVEQHTHEYTKWQYDEIWHWQVCPDDDTPDPAGKSVHEFVNGECECGAKEPVSNLAFELDEATNTYTVVGLGEETATEIVVPAFYQGKLVTKIGAKAFYVNNGTDATITSVTLPESVTEVGDNAFTHCTTLKEINLEHVEIVGQSAFWDVGLTRADLSSATSIKEYSFYGNGELSNVILGEALKTIADNAFTHCTALKEINLEHVEIVGQSAFWDVGIVKADLSSATSIMANAFYADGELGEVILGDALQTIGESAFCKCTALQRLTLCDGVTVGDSAFYGCTALSYLSFGPVLRVEADADDGLYSNFYNIATEAEIHFNGTFEEWCALDGNLFRGGLMRNEKYYNSGASSLNTNVSRTLYFGGNKFEGALTIPQGVEKIPAFAFLNTRSITSLTIPKSVKTIEEGAFEQVSVVDTLPVIYQGTLAEFCSMEEAWLVRCANYAEYTVNGVKLTGELAIPEGVETIPAGAFYSVKGVTSVSIPTSVKTFGIYALFALEISELNYAGTSREWNSIDLGKYSQGISYCGIPGGTDIMGRPCAVFTRKMSDGTQVTCNQSEFQR